jgi:hypothetical protein
MIYILYNFSRLPLLSRIYKSYVYKLLCVIKQKSFSKFKAYMIYYKYREHNTKNKKTTYIYIYKYYKEIIYIYESEELLYHTFV